MKFTATRKAIEGITSVKLRADYLRLVAAIEKASTGNKPQAGILTGHLIRLTGNLQESLTAKARGALLGALFADAVKAGVDHQWERKSDYECGPQDDCGKPSPKMTCFRDTSVPNSCFTVPSVFLPF